MFRLGFGWETRKTWLRGVKVGVFESGLWLGTGKKMAFQESRWRRFSSRGGVGQTAGQLGRQAASRKACLSGGRAVDDRWRVVICVLTLVLEWVLLMALGDGVAVHAADVCMPPFACR